MYILISINIILNTYITKVYIYLNLNYNNQLSIKINYLTHWNTNIVFLFGLVLTWAALSYEPWWSLTPFFIFKHYEVPLANIVWALQCRILNLHSFGWFYNSYIVFSALNLSHWFLIWWLGFRDHHGPYLRLSM